MIDGESQKNRWGKSEKRKEKSEERRVQPMKLSVALDADIAEVGNIGQSYILFEALKANTTVNVFGVCIKID
jgi:hypothetical protein